jgi:predicted permease
METLLQDVRYAARSLGKSPGFTLVVVLTLALGIGANAAIFSILDALFLRPPPGVHEPERIARLYVVRDTGMLLTPEGGPGNYVDYASLRREAGSFSSMAGQMGSYKVSLGRGEGAREVMHAAVTGGYFPTLGARPEIGRFFGPSEDTVPASAVAVISHAFWQDHFAGAPDVLGREIFLGGKTYTVVGVAPEHFRGIDSEPIDVWVPFAASRGEDLLTTTGFVGLHIFGRLAPGVPAERAAAEAEAVLRHAAELDEALDPTPGVLFGPVQVARGPNRSQTASVSLWLALVTGAVLLVASANVANLLLARAARRRREIAVRTALGAGRARLVRQLFTESMLLALLGGAAALLIVFWSSGLIRLFPIPPLPSLLDVRVLSFTFAVTILTGILFGLLPALQASRTDLGPALRDGAPAEGPSRSRTRTGLLISQVALSMVLLVGAGLLVRSAKAARSVDLGLDADRLLYVSVDLGSIGYEPPARAAFASEAIERLRALPGVVSVDAVQLPPFGGAAYGMAFEIPGMPDKPKGGEGPYVEFVGPEFFRTAGTPLLRGRAFTDADGETSPPVVVVNQSFADRYWPGGEPLGQCLRFEKEPCTEIIGVVKDIRHSPLADAVPKYYIPIAQQAGRGEWGSKTIVVRTARAPNAMIARVQGAVQSLAPELPYVRVIPATDLLGPTLQPFRLGAALFSTFAALALVLAAIGLYGVVSFNVAQRTREIGVRIALGAAGRDVLRLVVSRAMLLTLVGVAIGVGGAVAVTRFMRGLLYGVEPLDGVTFLSVPLLLIAVALIAAYLPARRAARVDPMVALRAE